MHYARIDNGHVAEPLIDVSEPPPIVPGLSHWVPVPEGQAAVIKEGWLFDPASFVFTAPTSTVPAGPFIIPLSRIRDNIVALDPTKWPIFAGLLDALPASDRWHLLTLQVPGISSDYAQAIAMLESIGLDPALVLK